ncbi:MAG: hypothetical protein ABSA26_06560 [Thermoguttaceae bacterium]|jgi:hypothetical protein
MNRKKGLFILIGFISAEILASAAHAQNQGGPNNLPGPGNGGMGGGGGMGGMGIGLGPMGKISLLNNEKLQQELDLSDDQKTKVAEAVGEASNAISTGMRKSFSSSPRNISPQEHADIREKLIKNNQDKFLKKLEKILLPKQFDRLKQIYLQRQGPMALSEPDVIKALNVNKEQQDKMQVLYDDFQIKLREATVVQGDGLVKFGGHKLDKMTKELDDNLLDILTADQRSEFEKMKGPKADVGSSSFKMEARGGRNGP